MSGLEGTNKKDLTKFTNKRRSSSSTLWTVDESPELEANDSLGVLSRSSTATIVESPKRNDSNDTIAEDYFNFQKRAENRKRLSRPPSWSSIDSVDSTKTILVDDFGNPIEYPENVASQMQLDLVQKTGNVRDLIGGSPAECDPLIKYV